MDERLIRLIERYASMVLEWMDTDAKEHKIPRCTLVEQFIDTLNALEQYREQED